jgi:hypothetical protein
MATVQRNKDALWQYIADDRAECSPEIKTIIGRDAMHTNKNRSVLYL